MVARQVTVYETQTPDGWDEFGVLTTLERATITQMVQQTVTQTDGDLVPASTASDSSGQGPLVLDTTAATPTTANVTPTTVGSSSSTSPSGSVSSQSPDTAQISTGSIVGIAVGSITALVLLIACLLFSFGFRIRRATRRGDTLVFERKESLRSPAGTSAIPYGKAELEDVAYTRALEKLHDGAKPELEASKPRKSGWRAFSLRSLKRGSGPRVAELDAGTVIRGVHELPA